MRYKRIAIQICEVLFLAEAGLLFLMQWEHALAWLNPLLVGSHFAFGLPLDPLLEVPRSHRRGTHTQSRKIGIDSPVGYLCSIQRHRVFQHKTPQRGSGGRQHPEHFSAPATDAWLCRNSPNPLFVAASGRA